MAAELPQQVNEALVKVQRTMAKVAKSGENKFDNYKYATLEDYINATHKALNDNGFALTSSVDELLVGEPRTTARGGTEYVTRVKMSFTLHHVSGGAITTTAWGEGQDRADKGCYKAITGARKYGLAALLNLATSDDPEGDESVGTAKTPRSKKATKKQEYATTTPPTNGGEVFKKAMAVLDKVDVTTATPDYLKQIFNQIQQRANEGKLTADQQEQLLDKLQVVENAISIEREQQDIPW